MAHYLNIKTWHRRDLFEFYRSYAMPYFNISARADCTSLIELAHARDGMSLSLAYHYLALRSANEIEPFRYRIEDDDVVVYDVINGGTTVPLPNESFVYAYFNYYEDFNQFQSAASAAIKESRAAGVLDPSTRQDLIYFTVLPWMSFTSFSNPHTPGRGESIPRVAFGKFLDENGRTWLPISIEVHHALMDGLHVGKFLTRLEDFLSQPHKYL